MAKHRVLIVDDHPMMRRGLRETLEEVADLEISAEVGDISEAVTHVRLAKPDVAILDVSLPSGSGLELAKQLLMIHGGLRILFVSMHDDTFYAERALRAGAMGYINKARPSHVLLEAVHKVARGEIALSPPVADRLMRRGVGLSNQSTTGVASLSDRELEVFELIGKGLTTQEVASTLCLSVKTVETHREHIKTKLGLESGAHLVRQAIQWTENA